MSELGYGTDTAEPATVLAQKAGDTPQHDETSRGAGHDGGPGAIAIEDRLPPRQDSRTATWDDQPDYDEDSLGSEYDGDLDALALGDQLPVRQESRTATWDGHPEQDESVLGSGYDGDLEALTGEDPVLPRAESRAATWDDHPDHDETASGASNDATRDPLTTEDPAVDDYALDSGKGDQDQAAASEAPPVAGTAGDPPVEASGTSAAAENDPLADSGSAATSSRHAAPAGETTAREVPRDSEPGDATSGEAAQPGRDEPVPGTAPEADLKQQLAELRSQVQVQVDERLKAAEARYQASLDGLKAEYEAGKVQDRQEVDGLRAELQALKDNHPLAAPDAPRDAGRDEGQPRFGDRKLPAAEADATEAKSEGDRPGLWSNAKTALYGGIGATGAGLVFSEFFPNVPSPVVALATGAVSVASLLVPVLREGRKGKHDNPSDKP